MSEPQVGAQSVSDRQRWSVFEDEAEHEEIDQREIESVLLNQHGPRLVGSRLSWGELVGVVEEAPAACQDCDARFVEDEDVYWESSRVMPMCIRCGSCAERVTKVLWAAAKAFAVERVRVMDSFPSPKEIQDWKESSHDSYWRTNRLCANALRHGCTNYDELIRGLERDDSRDEIQYMAIRLRVGELVDEFMNLRE